MGDKGDPMELNPIEASEQLLARPLAGRVEGVAAEQARAAVDPASTSFPL
jgi:hypothetical protein